VARPAEPPGPTLPTVVITRTAISVAGASTRRVLAALPHTDPRTIVLEADPALAYGRVRMVADAIGTPGSVTFVLRPR